MRYLALIGDIVDSKQLARRGEFQARLTQVLRLVSSRNAALASPYTITLGDEFQAVYQRPERLFADIFSIMAEIHPVRARFAIGVGTLSTAINKKQALGMDGPAFHAARAGILELKKGSSLLRFGRGDDGKASPVPWRLLTYQFNMLSHQLSKWSDTRLRILHGLLVGKTVSELEEELRISNVAVYKNIHAGTLDDIKGLCAEVTRLLREELSL